MRPHVCVISLALPIEVDPRTSRQVVYLSQTYDVTLIGFGNPANDWNHVTWKAIERQVNRVRLAAELALLILGRFAPGFYDLWLRSRPRYRQAIRCAVESHADIYHASDWAALALCAQAAKIQPAPIFFDADEYWPLENESERLWRWFFSPLIIWTLRKFAKEVDAATTVSQPIAERYKAEFQLDTVVMYNAPDYIDVPPKPTDLLSIKLMHHGAARHNRYLETMIDTVALLDERFSLHFMLVDSDPGYTDELRRYAERVAPKRVVFCPPVAPFEIVKAISDCDIGLCFIPPTTYTYEMTLPNKLFEFIMAGLAVITAPSPAMAEVVQQYQAGWVTSGFEARDLAATLNPLTVEQIDVARANAHEAAKVLNAEIELKKMLALYERLLDNQQITPGR